MTSKIITIKIWNPLTKNCESSFYYSKYFNFNLNFNFNFDIIPDARLVAIDGDTLKIWDSIKLDDQERSNEYKMSLIGHTGLILCMTIFPDCINKVITGASDNTLKIWEIDKDTYSCVLTLIGTMRL